MPPQNLTMANALFRPVSGYLSVIQASLVVIYQLLRPVSGYLSVKSAPQVNSRHVSSFVCSLYSDSNKIGKVSKDERNGSPGTLIPISLPIE